MNSLKFDKFAYRYYCTNNLNDKKKIIIKNKKNK